MAVACRFHLYCGTMYCWLSELLLFSFSPFDCWYQPENDGRLLHFIIFYGVRVEVSFVDSSDPLGKGEHVCWKSSHVSLYVPLPLPHLIPIGLFPLSRKRSCIIPFFSFHLRWQLRNCLSERNLAQRSFKWRETKLSLVFLFWRTYALFLRKTTTTTTTTKNLSTSLELKQPRYPINPKALSRKAVALDTESLDALSGFTMTSYVTLGKLDFLSVCHLQNVDEDICNEKQNLLIRKVSFPRCRESWEPVQVLPECERKALTPGLSLYQCPCPSAWAERKGCLSHRELVGTYGLWQNKREVPIKGGRAPQLERRADGSEAVRRGTSQFTKCVTVSWWPSGNQRGPPTSFPFFEEGQ